jgi:hypothetical protein
MPVWGWPNSHGPNGVVRPPQQGQRAKKKRKKKRVYGVWPLEVVKSALHWLYRRKYNLRLLKFNRYIKKSLEKSTNFVFRHNQCTIYDTK